MKIEEQILEIQRCFPRIYMACHQQHERGKSNATQLSGRDATLLAHLSTEEFMSPSRLAKHMNISQATLSEALAKLIELGYVTSRVDDNDGRRQQLTLTIKGNRALADSSVLDSEKLQLLLHQLDENQRQQALHGLRLLALVAMRLSA